MARNSGCWIGDEYVYAEDLRYDIVHKGAVVATFNTMEEVWNFYFAKEREVKAEKGGRWDYLGIGDHGLTMHDWASGKENDENTIKWKTVFRKKTK
jgi:hypothetical protein